mgnify:CR=1 FL=1
MTRITQTGEAVQQQGAKLTTLIPVHIRRSGGRKMVIPVDTSAAEAPEHHTPILTALSRAYHWQRLIDEGIVKSGSDIARQEGLNPTTVWELLRLTLLSPQIVRALLAGRQPKTLTLRWLKNMSCRRTGRRRGRCSGSLTGRGTSQGKLITLTRSLSSSGLP